jgi:pilus assembly protein TadC
MKNLFFYKTDVEKEGIEIKYFEIEKTSMKNGFVLEDNKSLFYLEQKNEVILNDGKNYNYINFDIEKRKYEIFKEVPEFLIYDEYFVKNSSPK